MIFTIVFLIAGFALVFSSYHFKVTAAESESTPLTYSTVIEIEDWGPAITKVIINLGAEVSADSVTVDTFDVNVVLTDDRAEPSTVAEGTRTVTSAYLSDAEGIIVEEGTSNYVVLEMEIGPTVTLGNAMNYDFATTGHNDWIDYSYTVSQLEDIVSGPNTISGLIINTLANETRVLVDQFNTGEAIYDDVTLSYANYSPEKDNEQNPLFIWLHGAAEGGTDPTVAIGGNKVVNFITVNIQGDLDNAYVLAPQTPTMWMDDHTEFGDGTSIYQEALMALIEGHIAKNPDIDPNRIYIGGASNGGYMTMLMLRDYPGYFAAGIPTCEALDDVLITDADIDNLAKTPIWFVHAKSDTVVDPNTTVVPTYDRLVATGADVHLSLYENVVDQTGLYTDENGNPYDYLGHFSWIHVYNNDPTTEIDGKTTTIMEWLGNQMLVTNKDDRDKAEKSGNELPDTATSTFNYLLLGVLVIMIAGMLIIVQKRKRELNNKN